VEYDFFLSRRGSVAKIAEEVADVLRGRGYKIIVQDYDFRLGDSVIERMHDGVKNSRDLIILFSRDYEQSPYTGRSLRASRRSG
jgi:TIR domain